MLANSGTSSAKEKVTSPELSFARLCHVVVGMVVAPDFLEGTTARTHQAFCINPLQAANMMQPDAFCFGQMRLKDPQLCSEIMAKGHVGELWHIKCQRESNKSRAKLRKALPLPYPHSVLLNSCWETTAAKSLTNLKG